METVVSNTLVYLTMISNQRISFVLNQQNQYLKISSTGLPSESELLLCETQWDYWCSIKQEHANGNGKIIILHLFNQRFDRDFKFTS